MQVLCWFLQETCKPTAFAPAVQLYPSIPAGRNMNKDKRSKQRQHLRSPPAITESQPQTQHEQNLKETV
ncbi:hypothetical protein AMECASPLE_024765 [Ameca splendens]|uniref:Uncharacterized protein n=1 Tax=Ameca splendens TaxID=208324 RepID=A0ABV0XHE1_9TELE